MSAAKEKYTSFLEDNYVPIFFRPHYLDAVCDVSWDVVLYEDLGDIRAAYIYMLKKKFGIKYIVQPQLCPYTGPVFFKEASYTEYTKLVKTLPKHQLLIQDFHFLSPDISEDTHVQYGKHTWVIHHRMNAEQLWEDMSSKHRRIIKKAESELEIKAVEDVDGYLQFVETTFTKRGKAIPHNRAIFKKLDAALSVGGNRKIVQCVNKEGVTVAMCYFVLDEKWTYNLANSVIDDYRHYGMNLILWNEIKLTLSESRSFDFEGSMIPGVDELFGRFKGEKKSYPSIYRSRNVLMDFLAQLKGIKQVR